VEVAVQPVDHGVVGLLQAHDEPGIYVVVGCQVEQGAQHLRQGPRGQLARSTRARGESGQPCKVSLSHQIASLS